MTNQKTTHPWEHVRWAWASLAIFDLTRPREGTSRLTDVKALIVLIRETAIETEWSSNTWREMSGVDVLMVG